MRDLPELLRPGDALVVNDTRVIPARLSGRRIGRGEETPIEANLHQAPRRLALERFREAGEAARRRRYRALRRRGQGLLSRPARRDRRGKRRGRRGHLLVLVPRSGARPGDCRAGRHAVAALYRLAPRADDDDRTDYQTLFAQDEGSVAAPTAGLHFTDELVARLTARGIGLHTVTLHVGAGHVPAGEDRTIRGAPHARRMGHRQRRPPRRVERKRDGRAGASSLSARRRCACSRAPQTRTARSVPSRARPRSSSRRAIGFAPSTRC